MTRSIRLNYIIIPEFILSFLNKYRSEKKNKDHPDENMENVSSG